MCIQSTSSLSLWILTRPTLLLHEKVELLPLEDTVRSSPYLLFHCTWPRGLCHWVHSAWHTCLGGDWLAVTWLPTHNPLLTWTWENRFKNLQPFSGLLLKLFTLKSGWFNITDNNLQDGAHEQLHSPKRAHYNKCQNFNMLWIDTPMPRVNTSENLKANCYYCALILSCWQRSQQSRTVLLVWSLLVVTGQGSEDIHVGSPSRCTLGPEFLKQCVRRFIFKWKQSEENDIFFAGIILHIQQTGLRGHQRLNLNVIGLEEVRWGRWKCFWLSICRAIRF